MKQEALKLADKLDNLPKEASAYWTKDSSVMIRKLVEELDKRENQIAIFERTLMQSRIEKSLAIADRNRLVKDNK